MNGRQIGFFLGPSDQEPFERVLRAVGDLAIIKSRSQSSRPELQDSTITTHYGKEPLRVLLARSEDVGAITFQPIKGRAEYSCNPTFELVVEFDRSYAGSELIRPGRLYYIPSYYDGGGNLVAKPKVFLDWADRLLKAARNSLKKVERGLYAGAEALELRKSGLRFEGT